MYVCNCVCMYVFHCVSMCVLVCVYVCMYVFNCVCICVIVYVCIYLTTTINLTTIPLTFSYFVEQTLFLSVCNIVTNYTNPPRPTGGCTLHLIWYFRLPTGCSEPPRLLVVEVPV